MNNARHSIATKPMTRLHVASLKYASLGGTAKRGPARWWRFWQPVRATPDRSAMNHEFRLRLPPRSRSLPALTLNIIRLVHLA